MTSQHEKVTSSFSSNVSSSWGQQQTKQQSTTSINNTSTIKDFGFESSTEHVGQEIQQNELKTKIESVITDLEQDQDFVDFSSSNNNKAMANDSPAQTFSPTPFLANQQKQASLELFSPPPLEPLEPPSNLVPLDMASPQLQLQPQRSTGVADTKLDQCFKQSSSSTSEVRQTTSFSEMVNGNSQQENVEVNQQVSQLARVMTGGLQQEAGELSNSSSSSLLQKIMTPAQVDFDSGSLKRRNPKKMFSDSSFYNSEKHPTVADQVEMAQKISKAMFSKDNKIFANKVQSTGDENISNSGAHPEDLSNLKLIMNPEGKVHEWGDIPADQLPNADLLAGHAVAAAVKLAGSASDAADSGIGGELFAKRREKADNWVVEIFHWEKDAQCFCRQVCSRTDKSTAKDVGNQNDGRKSKTTDNAAAICL